MPEPSVRIEGCSYLVTDTYGKSFIVGKDRSCSCGKQNCWHIGQVKRYLDSGDKKAPDKPKVNTEYLEAMFTGQYLSTRPQTFEPPERVMPTPNANLKEFWQRAERIRTKQRKMESGNACDVAQYWIDLRTLSKTQMCEKWNLPIKVIDPIPEQLGMGI